MKEPLTWRESRLIQQAQIWKSEARCANDTIAQIYQLVTGARGEPGNWNGANPVRNLIAERDDLLAQVIALSKGEG